MKHFENEQRLYGTPEIRYKLQLQSTQILKAAWQGGIHALHYHRASRLLTAAGSSS